jgi:activating signal cointegrator 1
VKAFSLWQPWATAIWLRWKLVETRHWYTNYRGPLAIHAAKRWTGEEREFWTEMCGIEALDPADYDMPFGAVIATVRLVDVVRTEQLAARISEREERWGNYSDGRYGFVFDDVVPLAEPIPFKGAQGFFEVPDQLFGLPVPPPRQGALL